MKTLLYGINYAPELTGIGKYTGELGGWLSERNHDVKVITAYPYYPDWNIHSPYAGRRWWSKERAAGGELIIRCPLYVPRSPGATKRIIHELSFLLSSSLALLVSLFDKVDVMVCVVTPFHLGIPARLFSWLKGIPMVYHVQDLQVDAAEDMGMLDNKTLLGTMKAAERWVFRRADRTSTISEGMRRKISAKGPLREDIILFPNWVDTAFIRPLEKEDSLKETLGFLPSDRVVLYAGNLGEKQGLEMIIEVAARMTKLTDLYFVIVGEGGAKQRLVSSVAARGLSNVRFFPLQAYHRLSALLAVADLHLVLQKKAAADLVMPSKLTTILAAGGCALVTAEEGSSLYDVVHSHRLGIVVAPEDVAALTRSIASALNDDLARLRTNARTYAENHLDRNAVLGRFEAELLELTRPVRQREKPTSVSA